MSKTIFITGTSTGLGKLTAIHFAKQGWNVAATMRRPEEEKELTAYERIKIFKLDVTDVEQVKTATAQAIAAFGTIDVVVNNAGMGTFGALELVKEDAIDWQFAVNVRGPINVIRAFTPHFRANKGGMFINISSLMGVTSASPVYSLYNMSKFALEGLTEGLYYELKALNIDVRLVEQGGSEGNNFLNNMVWSEHPEIRDYDAITERVKHRFANADASLKSDPQEIVTVIYNLATGENKQFRTLVGEASKQLVALRNAVPIEEFLEKMAANFA
jgi:NAD(P)-dependent dehydrogenase (short-subunit alcohol dehydrogenase family)